MRNVRWFSISVAILLLLSSCMYADVSASLDSNTVPVFDSTEDETPMEEEPTIAVAADTQDDNECLSCHSDKDRLISTAKEEEVVEAESSGVG